MWILRETSYELDEIPAPFGWFHLVFLFLTLLVLVISLIKIKKLDTKKMDKVMFGCGLFLLLTEIYKQLLCSLVVYPNGYPWHLFPFQLCSVPMYLFLIVPFLKEGKVKTAIYSFLGYFMTMSGVMFYLIPSLSHVLSVSIHSMIWHMILIVIGIIILIIIVASKAMIDDTTPIIPASEINTVEMSRFLAPKLLNVPISLILSITDAYVIIAIMILDTTNEIAEKAINA